MALSGYALLGSCSADTNTAVVKWVSQFPMHNPIATNTGLIYPVNVSINATGLISYGLRADNGTMLATGLTEQLIQCDPNYDPDPFSVTYAMQVFGFFFSAVVLNYFLANQIGSIINHIKKNI